MVSSRQNRKESVGLQCVDHFVSLERRRDQKANRTPSVRVETDYTNHTDRSHLRPGSHISHDEETRNLRLEIDHLRKKLRHREHVGGIGRPHLTQGLIRRKILPIGKGLEPLPPSNESFSASLHLDREERHKRRRVKSSPLKSIGNDAMSKALRQISKSPFTRKIDKAKLLHHFAQPTFTIYNGRIDPIEHVSHFN